MSDTVLAEPISSGRGPDIRGGGGPSHVQSGLGRLSSWIPTRALVSTRFLELRKRRAMMIVIVLLTVAVPCLVFGIRLLMHAFDPTRYGPAGSPGLFSGLTNLMASLGFLVAAAFGATAGATDLSEGVFRQLVITGRSRVALYLSRIPSGLAILLPLAALGFTVICIVTSFAGLPSPSQLQLPAATVPAHLSEAQYEHWLLQNPNQAQFINSFYNPGPGPKGGGGGVVIQPGGAPNLGPAQIAQVDAATRHHMGALYSQYSLAEVTQSNPAINEMVKIGAWLELDLAIGFLVGLGLGSLTGHRTISTIIVIALELILTPIFASTVIPYFLDGQRLLVGVAMEQLRPIGLGSAAGPGGAGPGRALFGGHALGIPAMPEWAMISVIVGWTVVWTGIGAWRMARRDA